MARGTAARSVVGSAFVGVILFVALVNFAPDATPYSPNNQGWDGTRDFASNYHAHFVNSLGGLNPRGAALLIMQPVYSFSPNQAQNVYNFAQAGGMVVLAGYSPSANSLLQQMGIGVQIQEQYGVQDATYNWKGQALPVALVDPLKVQEFGFLAGISGVAMDEPSPLAIATGSSAQPLAISSPLSFEAARSSTFGDLPEIGITPTAVAPGPFVVVAADSVGAGTVVILGDPQFFTNSLWNVADNGLFAANLFSNVGVYVDSSHWPANTIPALKAEFAALYSYTSGIPLRYLLALAFVAAAVGVLPIFASESPPASGEGVDKRLQTTYNEAVIERVRKDRRRNGT